jgi:hypothetical protein
MSPANQNLLEQRTAVPSLRSLWNPLAIPVVQAFAAGPAIRASLPDCPFLKCNFAGC